MRGIATNVSVYQTFAAERSESEPGQRKIVRKRRTVEGSSVPQMCPKRWCGTHAFNTPESVRFRTREKMKAKPPHHVILDKDFAGIPKGSKLHISCPIEVAAELKTITPGSTMSIQAFRRRLAEKNHCDATCPVSTSLFLRIVAEHSWEEYCRTGSTRDVAPFWRVLESNSPMAKKLSFDPAWIDLQREIES